MAQHNRPCSYFITGTDTDVGKTFVTGALLQHFKRHGIRAIGFKPISAGCDVSANGLVNQDALTIQRYNSQHIPLNIINPIAYQSAIAPHIAAKLCGQSIEFAALDKGWQQLRQIPADVYLIEGAGGWMLPINPTDNLNQWVEQQQFAVILVVGIKLGCLNHALMTAQMIEHQGLTIAGWVANIIDPQTSHIEHNIDTLKVRLAAPHLATIPYFNDLSPDEAYQQIIFTNHLHEQ